MILYTKSECPLCTVTKVKLNTRGIDFEICTDEAEMEKLGIELDWVLVLTMDNDGFIEIPMVAEYCVPHKDSGRKPGWYKDDIDNPNMRIDDWTNVIMFKLLDKPYIDGIRDSILDKYKDSECITDTNAYNLSFNDTVIKQCNGIK